MSEVLCFFLIMDGWYGWIEVVGRYGVMMRCDGDYSGWNVEGGAGSVGKS